MIILSQLLVASWFWLLTCQAYVVTNKEDFVNCFFSLVDNYGITVSYNLSDFRLDNKAYQVFGEEGTFKYLFNFCSTVPSNWYTNQSNVPASCYNAPGPCTSVNSENPQQCDTTYNVSKKLPLALQIQDYPTYVDKPTAKCHWLGAELEMKNLPDYNVSLLDPNDAGRGILFEYMNGEWCSNAGYNRKLRVKLECPDSNRYYFDPKAETRVTETVTEDPDCVYTLSYKTPLACPIACITKEVNSDDQVGDNLYAVCNGKGICVSDPIRKYVRCLCDDGWSGDTCNERHSDVEQVKEDHSGVVSAIIVCIVLLVVVLALSAWIFYQIRVQEERQKGRLGHEFFSPILPPNNNAALDSINADTAPHSVFLAAQPDSPHE